MDTILSAALCFLAFLYGVDSQTPVPARPLGKPQVADSYVFDQYVPIPVPSVGYNYVTCQDPKIVLEVFYDQ